MYFVKQASLVSYDVLKYLSTSVSSATTAAARLFVKFQISADSSLIMPETGQARQGQEEAGMCLYTSLLTLYLTIVTFQSFFSSPINLSF